MTSNASMTAYQNEDAVRDRVKNHLGVVKRLVHELPATMSSSVRREDLVSAGVVGLVEAAHRYDPERGVRFVSCAYRRVRGAIVDYLRRRDTVSKSARKRMQRIRRHIRDFREKEGRKPSIAELSRVTGFQEDTISRLLSYERWDRTASLDSRIQDEEGSSTALSDTVPGDVRTPLEKLKKRDRIERMTDAMERLPERQRKVLVLYYYEELYMKEIGEVLGLSESRISQLHSRALYRLSREME